MNTVEKIPNYFETNYPNISEWLVDGTLEIGNGEYGGSSFIKVIDAGGVIWEGKGSYPNLDKAFDDAEKGITDWLEENA